MAYDSKAMEDSAQAPAGDRDRYEIRRQLGSGGASLVFEAYDHRRRQPVALKKLRYISPSGLLAFKREFRALADIAHPNLITLHELFSVDGEWTLSMELVRGGDWLDYVRPGSAQDPLAYKRGQGEGKFFEEHEARLRRSLQQLAEGVMALHAHDRLHRDLKPSNVLVSEATGRVVICDFGLVVDLAEEVPQAGPHRAAGTWSFMSPEQAAGRPLDAASDWYAVGVMLYLGLTGLLPFPNAGFEATALKRKQDPPHPSSLAPNVPRDLADLAMALLHRDPHARANGEVILGTLLGHRQPTGDQRIPFVGRRTQRDALKAAFDQSRQAPVGCLLYGPSGIGKSELSRAFCGEVQRLPGAVVLQGRCYEHENVPYKAVDGIIDDLSALLRQKTQNQLAALKPSDVGALARTFPVLAGIFAPHRPGKHLAIEDGAQVRFAAVRGLQRILRALSEEGPLVLSVDDLQWADDDGLRVLLDLLAGENPPTALLLGTLRVEGDEHERNQATDLFRAERLDTFEHEVSAVAVGPLKGHEASELVAQCAAGLPLGAGLLRQITEAAEGNPFMLAELTRHIASSSSTVSTHELTIADMMFARVEELGALARHTLELVCIAGAKGPADLFVRSAIALVRAASPDGLDPEIEDAAAAVAQLREQRLVRTSRKNGVEHLEPFHDQVHQAVLHQLSPGRKRVLFAALAPAWRDHPYAAPEQVVALYQGAGNMAEARAAALSSAQNAMDSFSFARAAELYMLALETPNLEDPQGVRHALADALMKAGRAAEAAELYLVLAENEARPARAAALHARGALTLMQSGDFDRGFDKVDELMRRFDLSFPKSPMAGLARVVIELIKHMFAFRKYDPVRVQTASEHARARAEICHAVAFGTGGTLGMISAPLVLQSERLSRTSLHAAGYSKTLSILASFFSTLGPGMRRRAVRALAAAKIYAGDDVEALALRRNMTAFLGYQSGQFEDCIEHAKAVYRLMARHHGASRWIRTSTHIFELWAHFHAGHVAEQIRLTKRYRAESLALGDVWGAHMLQTGLPALATLFEDQPQVLRAQVQAVATRWSQRSFHLQHYWGATAMVHHDLYVGDDRAALARIRSVLPYMKVNLLHRVIVLRVESQHLLARCLLAGERFGSKEAQACRRAIRVMRRSREPWHRALSDLVEAQYLLRRDAQPEVCLARFTATERRLVASGLGLFALVAGYYRARLEDGGVHGERAEEALASLAALGVVKPAQIVRCFAPVRGHMPTT